MADALCPGIPKTTVVAEQHFGSNLRSFCLWRATGKS